MKRWLSLSTIIVISILISGCAGFVDSRNGVLQERMNEVISEDYRNNGIVVSSYMKINNVMVFDLQSISGGNSRIDVFRVFLQFADKNQDMNFQRVELAFKGKTKFFITGSYYQKLGEEYSWQNPIYTTRTFPSHLYYPDGNPAYGEWTGGLIGVVTEQIEDFTDFHDKWYWDSL